MRRMRGRRGGECRARYGGQDTNTDTLLHIPSDADSAAFVDGLDTHRQRVEERVPPALYRAVMEEAHGTEAKLAEVKSALAEKEVTFDDAFLPLSPVEVERAREAEEGDGEGDENDDRVGFALADVLDVDGTSCLRNPEGGSVCVTLSGLMEPLAVRVDAVAARSSRLRERIAAAYTECFSRAYMRFIDAHLEVCAHVGLDSMPVMSVEEMRERETAPPPPPPAAAAAAAAAVS